MRTFDLSRLSDVALVRDLTSLLAQERSTLAAVLAHVAEVDSRRLYLPAGCPSMFAYCVGELRMSEDAAKKRIQAARAARQFAVVFAALAAGRVHLTGLCQIAPYLSAENADALLSAVSLKTCSEIALILGERFPTTESLPLVSESAEGAAQHVSFNGTEQDSRVASQSDESRSAALRSIAKPTASDRVTLQLTISRAAYEQLQYAQSLMSHVAPSGDLAAVIERGAEALVTRLEKQRFAATGRPRARAGAPSDDPRYLPAHVRRAVWERDGGRCTFVGDGGHRCESRTLLEFDHIVPVARDGAATLQNLRLRCRGHNQLDAERVFGERFMEQKREGARSWSKARVPDATVASDTDEDLAACLRELGYKSVEIRGALTHGANMRDATLEERVRAALKHLCPRARTETVAA